MGRCELSRRKAAVFKALGHPTRLEIVEKLALREHCVCELVAVLPGSQATTSKHLEVLLGAGIVERNRDGVRMVYSLALPCVLKAIPCIEEALERRPRAKRRAVETLGVRTG
ncbi:MAG: ArsR/SmtB family transcription factor [Planctomycetota bacterium]|jgi:ArsR family transcriptional regulator